MAQLNLDTRDALPDALRVLLKEFPREAWELNPNYSQLIKFWLDRHLMFRRLLDQLEGDAEAILDRKIDALSYARKLGRFGGMFVNELHGHHQIEDAHYFPVLQKLDRRFSRGFEILDKDHHALDGILNSFTVQANKVLQNPSDSDAFKDMCAGMKNEIDNFAPMLNRHLIDEEELVVPVLLKYAPRGLQ